MSRTDKDRPYWVIQNDRTLGTVEHHDHVYRHWRGYRITKRGERTLVPYGEPTWILRYSHQTPGMTPEEHETARYMGEFGRSWRPNPDFTSSQGRLRWYYEQPMRYEWVGRITEPVEEFERCTIDEPYQDWRRDKHTSQPCTTEVPRHAVNTGWDYPKSWQRQEYHRQTRRAKRTAMRNFTVEYNTHGDVDDSTWQDFQTRNAPYNGGWWD